LGGLAMIIVGVADPALAGHSDATATGGTQVSAVGPATSDSASQSSTASNDATSNDSNTADATAGSNSCANGTPVTGDVAQTRWGPVQVAGTVANGKLCEAHAVVWPDGDGRSVEINNYAIPQLDAQAAQGSQLIDGVSGATYTSQGYYTSLQSILDRL
jgi:uncharacterized protein with FMN-binding domain